jgi:hypothetical protein
LVPIAADDEELEPDAVLPPDELHAATPAARITAAAAVRTLGFMDLWLITKLRCARPTVVGLLL